MKGTTIYEFFSDYNKEQVNEMITLLSKNEKKLLKLRYGDNLDDSSFKSQLTKKQKGYYYSHVVTKMKKLLNDNIKKRREYWHTSISIYDYYDDYSREEIDLVLKKLKKAERNLIELRCGKDLDRPVVNPKMSRNEKIRFSRYIIPKIKRMLENPNEVIKGSITKYQIDNVYDYFNNYSEEEINEVLKYLSEEEKEILTLRFNNDEKNNIYNDSRCEQYQKWYNLIKKVKKTLENPERFINVNNGRVCKTIYSYFPEHTKEDVDTVIEQLPQKDKDVINLRYRNKVEDGKLWTDNDRIRFFKGIIPKMRGKLKKLHSIKSGEKKLKSIYMRYPEYSKEDVDNCLKLLEEEEKRILSLKYSDVLPASQIKLQLSEIEKKRISYIINDKLKNFLARINDSSKNNINDRRDMVSIYEHFIGYKKEQINEVIRTLSDEEKFLLKLQYGDDLEKPVKNVFMTNEQKSKFKYLLLVTITKKLETLSKVRGYINVFEAQPMLKATSNQLKILLDLIHSSEYVSLLEQYSTKEVMVLFLYFVGINGMKFSIKMISDFLSLEICEVKNIIENHLIKVKNNLISMNSIDSDRQLVYMKSNDNI